MEEDDRTLDPTWPSSLQIQMLTLAMPRCVCVFWCVLVCLCVHRRQESVGSKATCGLTRFCAQGICKSAVDIHGTTRRRLDREALERRKIAVERFRKPLGQKLVAQTRHLHGLQGQYFMRTEDLLPKVHVGRS